VPPLLATPGTPRTPAQPWQQQWADQALASARSRTSVPVLGPPPLLLTARTPRSGGVATPRSQRVYRVDGSEPRAPQGAGADHEPGASCVLAHAKVGSDGGSRVSADDAHTTRRITAATAAAAAGEDGGTVTADAIAAFGTYTAAGGHDGRSDDGGNRVPHGQVACVWLACGWCSQMRIDRCRNGRHSNVHRKLTWWHPNNDAPF
jgi:hypothetical protein